MKLLKLLILFLTLAMLPIYSAHAQADSRYGLSLPDWNDMRTCDSWEEPSNIDTIETAVQYAVLENEDVKKHMRALEDAEILYEKSRMDGYFPTLTLNSGYTVTKIDKYRTEVTSRSFCYGITLNGNVFDGFQTTHNIAVAGIRKEAAELAVQGIQAAVAMQTIRAYMDIYKARELLETAYGAMHLYDEVLKIAIARSTMNGVDPEELSTAKASFENAKAAFSADKSNLCGTYANFNRVVGQEPEAEKLHDRLRTSPVVPTDGKEALERAGRHNPLLRISFKYERAASEAYEASRGRWWPRVDAFYRLQQCEDPSIGSNSETLSSTVGLQMTWTFSVGNQILNAPQRLAKNRWENARSATTDLTAGIKFGMRTAYAFLDGSEARLVGKKIAYTAAKEAVMSAKDEFERDRDVVTADADITSLLGFIRLWHDSKRAYSLEYVARDTSKYEINLAMGVLIEELSIIRLTPVNMQQRELPSWVTKPADEQMQQRELPSWVTKPADEQPTWYSDQSFLGASKL